MLRYSVPKAIIWILDILSVYSMLIRPSGPPTYGLKVELTRTNSRVTRTGKCIKQVKP